jgi:hypothetical protein
MAVKKDSTLKRLEKGPLDRLNNQNFLIKKFGKDGLLIYSSIDNVKTVQEILDETGISEDTFYKVLDFMVEKNMIDVLEDYDTTGITEPELTPEELPEPEETFTDEEKIKPEEEEEIKPPEILQSEITPEEIKPEETPEQPETMFDEDEEELRTSEEKIEIKPTMEEEEKEDQYTKTLTPVEKKVYNKFGKKGVKVYSLIDGEKTAEEILKEAKINDVQLIEILEYLDNEGIIKLEKPDKRHRLPDIKPITDKTSSFEMLEQLSPEAGEIIGSDIVPIDIPVKKKLPIMKKLIFSSKLIVGKGRLKQVYNLIDSEKNIIDLCISTGIPLPEMDDYMEYLSNQGVAMFKTMTRDEISARYGDEGLSIYKKFGRGGILIYEYIGTVSSFKEIISKSGLNPEKVIDIFIFIHKVLNLELPLTRDTMYKQLGLV